MSRSASDVSIVTINWNGRDHLATLLPTLEQQEPGEILVVDNASLDGSREWVAKHHPRVRWIQNPVNRGFAHPCNRGAEEAKGSVVAFINNDMRALPGWIQQAVARLTPETPCVASRILDWNGSRIDFNGSSLQYLGFGLQKDIGELAESVRHDDRVLFPCGGAFVVLRDAFLSLGGFDEDFFAIFEDVDFGWRLWLSGSQIAFSPDSAVCHRGHASFAREGNEKMRYLMHRNALAMVLKNYDEENFSRIAPLAIRLAIKRAVLLTGVQKESFYMWAGVRQEIEAGDPRSRERWIDALNHLVALDDILDDLPRWMAKRKAVQQLRRRPDSDIVRLFQDPLRRIVEDPDYQLQEDGWLGALHLERLFEAAADAGSSLPEAESRHRDRLRALRRELRAGQWLSSWAAQHPKPPSAPAHRALLHSLRREGLRTTLRRVRSRISRGH